MSYQDILSVVVNPSTATGRTYTLSHLEMAAASAALVGGRFKYIARIMLSNFKLN